MKQPSKPKRMRVRGTREEIEKLIVELRTDPKLGGWKKVLFENDQIKMVCPDCGHPVIITDVDFA